MSRLRDLYFLLNPAVGIIKIGIADDVEVRRKTLECACGIGLEVLRIVPGCEMYEERLHLAFGPQRLLGEWFAPSDELVDLATGTADIPEFVAQHAVAIGAWRDAEIARKARLQAEDREASREEREAAAALKAEEERLRQERAARMQKVREKGEQNRLAREAAQRERSRVDAEAALLRRLAANTGLPESQASQIAEERRGAIARRARNLKMLGIRRPETIARVDLRAAEGGD